MYAQYILLVFKEEIKALANIVHTTTLCETGLLNINFTHQM